MKLIQRDGEDFVFHISKREKRLLLEMLNLYPLIPTAHHRVSRTASAKKHSAKKITTLGMPAQTNGTSGKNASAG